VSKNEKLQIPSFGYEYGPLGLDLRQVIKRNKPFLINTGTLLACFDYFLSFLSFLSFFSFFSSFLIFLF
jgi:hypothetical protein